MDGWEGGWGDAKREPIVSSTEVNIDEYIAYCRRLEEAAIRDLDKARKLLSEAVQRKIDGSVPL